MKKAGHRYDVSVIIPTYNESQLLSYTLTSLVKQDVGRDAFEVIVADDGSSDNTKETVEKFAGELNLKYFFQADKGYRPASARNLGIRAAEGRICIFIDTSVILNTHCLGEHINFYKTRGKNAAAIGYVYGLDYTLESENLVKEMVIPEDPYESVRRLSMDKVFRDVRELHYAAHQYKIEILPAPWAFFWTCHVSALTEDLRVIGMFDENYDGNWGMEDFDLGFRLHQAGIRIFLLRSAESIHYPHAKDMIKRKQQGFQNCTYFNNKFKTAETDLYFRNYHHIESVDINSVCMQVPGTVTVTATGN